MSRFKESKEKNSGQIVVETAGYRPLGVIIHTLEVAEEDTADEPSEEPLLFGLYNAELLVEKTGTLLTLAVTPTDEGEELPE